MNYNVITVASETIIIDEFHDETGLLDRIVFDQASIPDGLPLFPPEPCELIYIRPDWPPIGSDDFAERLRAWHAEHNKNDAGSGPD